MGSRRGRLSREAVQRAGAHRAGRDAREDGADSPPGRGGGASDRGSAPGGRSKKDEFLATLAHELRNPLAPIRTGLELIRLAGSTPASIERVRGIMERQIGHMVRLIDDLLDISRITSGKIQLKRQTALLSDLVDGAVEATRLFISERQVDLSLHLPDAACLLSVDRTRFVQVLSTCSTTPRNSPIRKAVSTSWRNSRRARGWRLAKRRSRSPTRASALRPIAASMFDLFVQGEGLAGSAQGGLGIGLALVKRLVELHGGRVEAPAVDSAGH